jgi:hypothetical protein
MLYFIGTGEVKELNPKATGYRYCYSLELKVVRCLLSYNLLNLYLNQHSQLIGMGLAFSF